MVYHKVIHKSNIIHITPVFLPYVSGITNVVYEQVRELARRGHSVTVLTPHYDASWDAEEVIDGITVTRIKPWLRVGNGGFVPGIVSELKKALEDTSTPTVVQFHLPFFGGYEYLWLVRRLGQLRNIKLVTLYHHDPQLSGITTLLSIPSQLVFKSFVTSSDAVVVSSRDYAEHSALRPFINQCNIQAIPFGVDAERFKGSEQRTVNNEQQPVQILFVGAMDRAHHFKGVEELLRAVAQLRVTNYQLHIIGKGDLLSNYKKLAEELKIQDQVEFLGFVPDEELPQHYAQADLFVFPSTGKAEAFGMVALEAMSSGLPVIASNLPGVRTLIGREDMLVEPGHVDQLAHKIAELLRDPQMRDRIGRENRARVIETYTWEKVVDQLEKVYQL